MTLTIGTQSMRFSYNSLPTYIIVTTIHTFWNFDYK